MTKQVIVAAHRFESNISVIGLFDSIEQVQEYLTDWITKDYPEYVNQLEEDNYHVETDNMIFDICPITDKAFSSDPTE